MVDYFTLQFRLVNRQITSLGIHPLPGIVLGMAAFAALSALLFSRTEYASPLLLLVALGSVYRLGKEGRNDFLKSIFTESRYLKVRLLENLIIASPFASVLAIQGELIYMAILVFLSSLLAFVRVRNQQGMTVPTPFGRWPFEFIAGFRASWPLILFALFLAVMADVAGNFNLGVFAQLLLMVVVITFYLQPEDPFYVWIYRKTPAQFLMTKVRTGLFLSFLLSLPVILIIGFWFPQRILILFAFHALFSLCLAAFIAARYASFPGQVSVLHGILLAFGVTFPPLLVVLVPWLWAKAIQRLKNILP